MRDLIKRILKEEVTENYQSISYGLLSQQDKEDIKSKGVEVFNKLKLADFKVLNDFFKNHGLFYGAPSEEYLTSNIDDINFALDNLPLSYYTRNNLIEKRDLLSTQKKEGGRSYEFFHELPKEEKEKMVWSIVNMFDNNIMLWVRLINDWLSAKKRKKQIISIPSLINHYFSIQNGRKALVDLVNAMINRATHKVNIFDKTWGGGQAVEQNFKSELLKNGFSENDIYMFSGEKNIVDGVGIDLAVKCGGEWIPFQVKSNASDASYATPYKGYSTFPFEGSFILVSGNKIQSKLSDFCVPLDEPEIESEKKPKIPSNVDYFGSLGLDI